MGLQFLELLFLLLLGGLALVPLLLELGLDQRDRLLVLPLLVAGDVARKFAEVGVATHPLGRPSPQLGQEGVVDLACRLVAGLRHLVERNGMIEIGLAHRQVRGEARQHDIALHPFELRARTARPVELLHRDLDRPERRGVVVPLKELAAEVEQALHRAFAVGRLVADDQAAVVVLNRPREDLAGAGTELVGEHHERAVPGHARIDVVVGPHLLVGVLDLHHRSFVDEQAGELDRLGERAAAVVPQVERHAVDALLPEVVEQPFAVAGAALVLRLPLLGGGHVHVEARQVDDADPIGGAVGLLAVLDHLAAGLGILELDLGPRDVVDLGHGLTHRDHLQPYEGAPLAADELHHLVEIHVHGIDDLAVATLPHAHDPVLRLEPAVLVGGPAGRELHDRRVAVFALELRADAVELEPHSDLEVLERAGRHEGRVRVEAAGERRKIRLEQLVAGHLVHPLGEAAVAAEELLLRLLGGRLLHLLHEQLVLDPPPPQILDLGLGLRPLGRLTVDDDRLGLREIMGRVEQPFDQRQPRIDPLQEAIAHLIGEAHVAPLHEIVERVPLLHERIDVALHQIDLHRIERLQKGVEPAAGHPVVDRLLEEVLALQMPANRLGDVGIVGTGLRASRGRLLGGHRPASQRQKGHRRKHGHGPPGLPLRRGSIDPYHLEVATHGLAPSETTRPEP